MHTVMNIHSEGEPTSFLKSLHAIRIFLFGVSDAEEPSGSLLLSVLCEIQCYECSFGSELIMKTLQTVCPISGKDLPVYERVTLSAGNFQTKLKYVNEYL
ncbi:hypothetical protein CDAR_84291 [Caerostris darwini]|uniref:Uncharacterized protein n=1 Tax=Caerostris darwini TaxID=1538125 RepID=A0AAV4WZ63_9ARAC|nr:hypothetical protein CDAR_84291 [Caerostris darwini]